MTTSCQAHWYGRLDTLNIKIRPLFQILKVAGKKSEEEEQEKQDQEQEILYI